MQCPDPEPEVELKDILDDDVWWYLHIGYEVSSWFHRLLDAFGSDMPFEWLDEMAMGMLDREDPPPRCGPRIRKQAKLARERQRQRLAEGFSMSSSSLSSSISPVFPPARESFRWKIDMILSMSMDVTTSSMACHYGAPSKRAAILF